MNFLSKKKWKVIVKIGPTFKSGREVELIRCRTFFMAKVRAYIYKEAFPYRAVRLERVS